MVDDMIRKLTGILFGLILAVLCRVTVPLTRRLKNTEKAINVINCFNALTSTVSITLCLYLVSIYLANLSGHWLVYGLVPLQIFVLHWTYFAMTKQLEAINMNYSSFLDSLTLKWLAHSNFNETDWPSLENAMRCCGVEGPRSYMDFLQGVPSHCYNPDLITPGCSHLVKHNLKPMLQISVLLLRLTIFVELVILLISSAKLFKKLVSLIGDRKRKRIIMHCLNFIKNTY
ncbi:uncharacterized protein LOC6548359 [Drosophila erecta]|uniref:Tetraspanin n=1 Tax=Drosophila erecta TaxID=7220 RepID=B3NKQ8_DROER|nr:uncharacterized protein LOC6548359 [Drosophila erecta]EDV54362.1 uncharacterized protein Dere_GG21473 [Drosophila erecta]